FTANLFGPGISVDQVDYHMSSVDAGVKYRGLALEGEVYGRWLRNYVGVNTGGIPNISDTRYQVQASAMAVMMATAGLYDDSGKWLYHTGLPAKSGVGGGIIAVSPGKFGIAVVSPPLDDAGNSVRAQRAITAISNALGGNPYAAKPSRE